MCVEFSEKIPGVNTYFYITDAERLYGVINTYGKWKEN